MKDIPLRDLLAWRARQPQSRNLGVFIDRAAHKHYVRTVLGQEGYTTETLGVLEAGEGGDLGAMQEGLLPLGLLAGT